MKLLSIDTATAACSAALWVDGRVAARRQELLERGHAERLFPMIDEVMSGCGIGYGALDALAVTVGPGSFTGVRVGLAAARGIALAADLPTVGIGTLDALVTAVSDDEARGHQVLASLDARRDQVYVQLFGEDRHPLSPPAALTAEEAAALPPEANEDERPTVLVGSGSPIILPRMRDTGRVALISEAPALPNAANVAALAVAKGFAAMSRRPLMPLYLRGPGATPIVSPPAEVPS